MACCCAVPALGPTAAAAAGIDFAPRYSIVTAREPVVVASADVTGDGIADLLTGSASTSNLQIHAGLGGGRFASPVGIDAGADVAAIATADFDEDGDLDVAAGHSSRSVTILTLGPSGQVVRLTSLTTGGSPSAIAVDDLNADGHRDLVVVNSASRNASIVMGRGPAGFSPGSFTDIGANPVDAVVADVTGDGRSDIVAANDLTDTIAIARGNGDGTFAAPTLLPAGANPTAVAAIDVDRNGHLDLITANRLSNDVRIQLGIGEGRFTPGQRVLTSLFPDDLVVGDWNADGLVDLATANSGANNVSVIEGAGPGLLRPARQFQVGSEPGNLTTHDIDGNGSQELLVANSAGSTVSVLSPRPLVGRGTAKVRVRCPATRVRVVSAFETRCVSLLMSQAQVTELMGRPVGARIADGGRVLQWHYRNMLVRFSRSANWVTSIRTLQPGARTSAGIFVGQRIRDLARRLDRESSVCEPAGPNQRCLSVSVFTVTEYRKLGGRVAWIQLSLSPLVAELVR